MSDADRATRRRLLAFAAFAPAAVALHAHTGTAQASPATSKDPDRYMKGLIPCEDSMVMSGQKTAPHNGRPEKVERAPRLKRGMARLSTAQRKEIATWGDVPVPNQIARYRAQAGRN
ncbi:hypothetical protein SMC26_27050 [Actinomadura fulvescens]|uniref:Uncharacterized protein n=1 Tax=Actinomadura fulvescens TaxID=46160 RepID=A0ABN3PHY7_9ACTN